MVDDYAAFLKCTPVGRASDFMMARDKAFHFSWLGPERLVCCLAQTGVFPLLRIPVSNSAPRDLHRRAAY